MSNYLFGTDIEILGDSEAPTAEGLHDLIDQTRINDADDAYKKHLAAKKAWRDLREQQVAVGDRQGISGEALAKLLAEGEDGEKAKKRLDDEMARVDREVTEALNSKEDPDVRPDGKFPPPPLDD